MVVGSPIESRFDRDDQRLLDVIAHLAGLAAENLRLVDDLRARLREGEAGGGGVGRVVTGREGDSGRTATATTHVDRGRGASDSWTVPGGVAAVAVGGDV